MSRKLIRNLLLAILIPVVLFEIVCWIFFPFPIEPLRTLDLDNTLPGFKQNVRYIFGDDQVRYLDWKPGEKSGGSVRVLYVGGWATQGMLQNGPDTWWGQLHGLLKKKGLKVQAAARGFDHAGINDMASGMAPIIERLKPDVIVLNTGFDDVIVHSAEYVYDKEKLARRPERPQPSGIRQFLLTISQTARFKRWWSADSEANRMQNELGRRDVYRKFFDEKRKEIQGLPRTPDILRTASANDPLPEYLDGLATFRDIAAKNGAALILTGEATLHDSVMNMTEESQLLAFVALKEPEEGSGRVVAARPNPAWVMREMQRFAFAAEKFAAENKLPWIDANGQVQRSTENFISDVLLTDAGAAALAKVIAPVVEPVVREKAK